MISHDWLIARGDDRAEADELELVLNLAVEPCALSARRADTGLDGQTP